MWRHILACIFLALPGTQAISRNQCTNFNLNPKEDKIVQLYCTRENVASQKLVFGDPSDKKKFFVCTDIAAGCSGTCPNGIFDQTTNDCGTAPINCVLPAGADTSVPLQPLDPFIQNPCSQVGAKTCFMLNHSLKNKFIMCDTSTTTSPKVGQCKDTFIFNINIQACEKSENHIIKCNSGKNPCKPIPENQKIINASLLYFGCLDDPTKFIQCDRWGRMTVIPCRNKTVWSQKDLACVLQ